MSVGYRFIPVSEVCDLVRGSKQPDPNTRYELWSVPSFAQGSPEIAVGRDIGSAKILVMPDDVLVCKINPRINRVWQVERPLENLPQIASTEWVVLRIKDKQEVLPNWLRIYFAGPTFRDWVISETSGATGSHTRAKPAKILEQLVPIPPLPEQKRIVAILDEAFAGLATARANAEKNLANARELFESYLNLVLTEKGAGWGEEKLENLTEKITKGSSPKWQGIEYVNQPGVLFITSENVRSNAISLHKKKYVEDSFNLKDKKSILMKGDVLTNIVGASIGRTAIFNLDEVANINQAVCLLRCDENRLHNKYLAYLLNSPFFRQILHDNEIDNARANLSLGFFAGLTIPIPEVAEQIAIVEKADLLASETKRLEAIYQLKLNNLAELKQAILQKAFSGELIQKAA